MRRHRPSRVRLLAACLVAAGTAGAAAALPGAAPAAGSGFVALRAGDTVAVTGARLGCLAQAIGMLCWPTAAGAPRTGAYAVVLAAPGAASIVRVGKGLELTPVVTKLAKGVSLRRRAGEGAQGARAAVGAARTIRLGVGQVSRLRVAGLRSAVDCAVVTTAGTPALYCSLDDAVGPVPGSFAVLVSERQAAIGRIETSRSTTIVSLRTQPR